MTPRERDDRAERPGDHTGSTVDWTGPAEFDFADEVDGLAVIRGLGDELQALRQRERDVKRHLWAAITTLRQQHHTQPYVLIAESGLARQTLYNILARAKSDEAAGDETGGE